MVRQGIRRMGKRLHSNFQKKGVRQNYVLREIEKSNDQFFAYYKQQHVILDEEWDAFITSLRKDLPISFRIRGTAKEAKTLIDIMNKKYLAPITECTESNVHLPEPLPWYSFGFQMSMSRASIRSCPTVKTFHNFLVTEAEIGNISRQETVSMVPPLLLDVQSHHKVLDVCAAPGSKTMQIIEKMHEDSSVPSGIVVANDADNTRCYLLVRQALKRMPSSNCIVINEDATCLPTLFTDKDSSQPMFFDRVLCDVMCSGDGTFRKNPDLWHSWTPQKGNSLHKLQIRIAHRALQLLAVTGLMVYSTCSLNPIEDEAVVAELLRSFKGTVELVDVSGKLPGLKRSSGISTWKVIDNDMRVFENLSEVPQNLKSFFVPSFFQPSEEEAKSMKLERSFRILPHDQNTGGFFVAVLQKIEKLSDDFSVPVKPPLFKRRKCFKEDPFVFLEKDDIRWKEIAEHYGISKSFPYQNLLGRTTDVDRKRTLYFVNDAVKNFLQCNQEQIKVINAGIKMFGRVEHKFQQCRFRLAQDGVSTIFPFVGKRVLAVDVEDMCRILKPEDGNKNVQREKLKCNESLRSFTSGSIILTTEWNDYRALVCAWLGVNSIAAYISKEEQVHVLRMLGQDTSDTELKCWSSRQMKIIRKRGLPEEQIAESGHSANLAVRQDSEVSG